MALFARELLFASDGVLTIGSWMTRMLESMAVAVGGPSWEYAN